MSVIWRLLTGLALVAVLAFVGACKPATPPPPTPTPPVGTSTPPPSETQAATGVGQPAPDFTVTDIDGQSHNLKDYAGKIVVVDFWATYCKPCVEHLREYNTTQSEMRREGVEFLALSVTDSDAEMKGWRPEGFAIPLAKLDDKTHKAFFGEVQVVPIPQARVIDRKGIMRYSFGPEAKADEVKQAVESLLAEK